MMENTEAELEIVDLDAFNYWPAVAWGAALTFVLCFVPYSYMFCCIHFFLGGFLAVWRFASKNHISLSIKTGFKVAAITVFVGFFAYLLTLDFALYFAGGMDLAEPKEEMIDQFLSYGNPEMAETIATYLPDELEPAFLLKQIPVQICIAAFVALIFGFISGAFGAAFFKKGPLAQ